MVFDSLSSVLDPSPTLQFCAAHTKKIPLIRTPKSLKSESLREDTETEVYEDIRTYISNNMVGQLLLEIRQQLRNYRVD